MGKRTAALLALLATGHVWSAGLDTTSAEQALGMQLDACQIKAQTVFVMLGSGTLPGSDVDPSGCVSEGKDMAKQYFTEAKASYGKKKPPAELVDWRVEWASAFDAALPQMDETWRQYVQRVGQARQRAQRAGIKLGIASE